MRVAAGCIERLLFTNGLRQLWICEVFSSRPLGFDDPSILHSFRLASVLRHRHYFCEFPAWGELRAQRLGGRTTPLNEHVAYGFHVLRAKYRSSPIGDQLPPANFSSVSEFEVGVRHSIVCVKLI
jgi:hypothetical protein